MFSFRRFGAGVGAFVAAAAVAAAPASAAPLTPVTVTGFTADVIVGSGAVSPYSDDVTSNFDISNNYAFYEKGANASSLTTGLPADGLVTSLTNATDGSSITYQLAPDTGNNAVMLSTASGAQTLALSVPAQYKRLSIMAASSNASGTTTGTLTLNFTDSTTSSAITYNANDWFFVTTNNAINSIGRVSTVTNGFETNGTDPRLYQTVIDLTALGLSGKTLQSATFNFPSTITNVNSRTAIFAVSGEAVPEPAAAGLLTLGAGGLLARRRRRRAESAGI